MLHALWIYNNSCVKRQGIRYLVRKAGKDPCRDDKAMILKKRELLLAAIMKFEELGCKFLGDDATEGQMDNAIENEEMWDSDGAELAPVHEGTVAEQHRVKFPSFWSAADRHWLNLGAIATMELELRIAWADDLLQSMRLNVGQKSMHYVKSYCPASSKIQQTRARMTIGGIERDLDHSCRLYMANRNVMEELGLPLAVLEGRFRPVTKDDLKASPSLEMPNARGQSRAQLSWIWTVNLQSDQNNYLSECAYEH